MDDLTPFCPMKTQVDLKVRSLTSRLLKSLVKISLTSLDSMRAASPEVTAMRTSPGAIFKRNFKRKAEADRQNKGSQLQQSQCRDGFRIYLKEAMVGWFELS